MGGRFQFGIEEEFFLADAQTRGTPGRSLKAFHATVHQKLPDVERELMRSQLEIASPPTTSFSQARSVLADLRSEIAEIARNHHLLLLASGTHPLARWRKQTRTGKTRYRDLTREMQILARRDVVCGMHIHVEVPDPDRRVDLMNRLLPFMPLLLALSASSPFWQGDNTGLTAYRMSVWGEMPRTGLPELFASADDYERYVATMVETGAIKDASFLWWTLRPSVRYPTIELRVADSCTRLDDTLAIAALYRCLVRHATRHPEFNRTVTSVSRALALENLWRAQRDGVRASFIDEVTRRSVTCAEFLATLTEQLGSDADELDCRTELAWTRTIVANGTSADHQLAVAARSAETDVPSRATHQVVDWLAKVTSGHQPV